MHGVFGNPETVAREIQGQFRPGQDKIVRRKFGIIAKALFPNKTAWHVAEICDCDERQARRYLNGEFPIPYVMERYVNDAMHGVE